MGGLRSILNAPLRAFDTWRRILRERDERTELGKLPGHCDFCGKPLTAEELAAGPIEECTACWTGRW